jgi:hypothetical protein
MIRCIDYGNQLKPCGKKRFGYFEIEQNTMLFIFDQWYWSDFYEFKKQYLEWVSALKDKQFTAAYVEDRLKYYYDRCPKWAK